MKDRLKDKRGRSRKVCEVERLDWSRQKGLENGALEEQSGGLVGEG